MHVDMCVNTFVDMGPNASFASVLYSIVQCATISSSEHTGNHTTDAAWFGASVWTYVWTWVQTCWQTCL